jgi:hypothetical protein
MEEESALEEEGVDQLPDFDESWQRPRRQRSEASPLLSAGFPTLGETAIPNVGPATAHVTLSEVQEILTIVPFRPPQILLWVV